MDIQSALPNWMPAKQRRGLRPTPQCSIIQRTALESWYNDGFLIGLLQATEISEFWSGRCFNCQKEGHHWHQCKELLSLELQELSDKQDKE